MNIFQVHEIINIAMAVNGFEQRQAPQDLPTVWVEMSGHIGRLRVSVQETGWERERIGNDKDFDFDLTEQLIEEEMDEYKAYMASITPNLGEEAMQRV